MKILLVVLFLIIIIPKYVFAINFNETASCSFGDCFQLDLSGTKLVPCYSRTYQWDYASESCDFTSTRNQNDELVINTENLSQSLIYIFYATMVVAFFILILLIIIVPK